LTEPRGEAASEEGRRVADRRARGGLYTHEEVERSVYESLDTLPRAAFDDFVPVLTYRFARRRLHAQAQADGRLAKDAPEVLFVDVQNAGRSQISR
jgi:arsenate reductase (thioredoxin)